MKNKKIKHLNFNVFVQIHGGNRTIPLASSSKAVKRTTTSTPYTLPKPKKNLVTPEQAAYGVNIVQVGCSKIILC